MPLLRNTTQFCPAGTETFRLASRALFKRKSMNGYPAFSGYGTNLQNIEKSLRAIYWADDGKMFCQRDQSGAEALIVAYECDDGKYRQLFTNNVKPHVFVGLHNFSDVWKSKLPEINIDKFLKASIPELKNIDGWEKLDNLIKSSDNWQAKERFYYIAKMICHASNYGMSPPAFQMNVLQKSEGKIVLTKEQAASSLATYHTLFPEIRRWHERVKKTLYDKKMLYNLQGFPREFTEAINDSMFKNAFAFTPQSTVGSITNIAYTRLHMFILLSCNYIRYSKQIGRIPEQVTNMLDKHGHKTRNWDIMNNCHDSYLAQMPEQDSRECAQVMKYLIEQDLTSTRGDKFKMKSEVQLGYNWGVAKKPPEDADRNDPAIIKKYNLKGLMEVKI